MLCSSNIGRFYSFYFYMLLKGKDSNFHLFVYFSILSLMMQIIDAQGLQKCPFTNHIFFVILSVCGCVPRLWPCKTQCRAVSPCSGSAHSPVFQHGSLFLWVRPARRGRPGLTAHLTATGSSAGFDTQLWHMNMRKDSDSLSWAKMLNTVNSCQYDWVS